ncbi:MAG: putative bifunctional diguanylate cyclase/phosphodiesterase [Rhizobiaceae bacterium]
MLHHLNKYRRVLTIGASGFGGGMLGLWALKLSTTMAGVEALPLSTIGGIVSGLSALSASGAAVAFFSGADENNETIRKSIMIDPLTDLFSKSGIIDLVERQLGARTNPHKRVFLLDLEIDRFKEFNDLHGFTAGDELIRQVAGRLGALAGAIGQVGRFGGGEFGLILETSLDEKEIQAVCDHLIETLSGTYNVSGIVSAMTCSLGVVEIKAGGTVTDTVRGAHMALKQTRMSGRGCWSLFTSDMNVREDYRQWIEVEMRNALKRNEFQLHYQPQFSIIDGTVRGFEALIRWKHPKRGFISPSDFIRIAEDTGYINALGRWVVMQACRDAMEFKQDVPIAVNISPVQFLNGDIVKIVASALEQTGLPPHRLELEVTESTLIEDRTRAAAIFEDLAALGVKLAIDDFGTGYSNLGYLADLPFSKLKIDKTFIDRIEQDMHMAQIVSAIIALARALGATAIAEGVERPEQEVLLRAAGCTVIQGFLFSRPLPLEMAVKVTNLKVDNEHPNKNVSSGKDTEIQQKVA